MILGCDASGFSGNLDYDQIAADLEFVYLKATDGVNDIDKTLMLRANQLRAVGMGDRIGPYHFLRVRHGMKQDADEQIKQHLDARARAGCTLPTWLDVELDSLSGGREGTLAKALENPHGDPALKQTIKDEVRAACELAWNTWDRCLGGTLPFYSSPGEMQLMGTWQIPRIINYPLALAEYVLPPGQAPATPPTSPKLPPPFTTWAFHQFAGNVSRFGGSVDLVSFNGTIDDLKSL